MVAQRDRQQLYGSTKGNFLNVQSQSGNRDAGYNHGDTQSRKESSGEKFKGSRFSVLVDKDDQGSKADTAKVNKNHSRNFGAATSEAGEGAIRKVWISKGSKQGRRPRSLRKLGLVYPTITL